MGENTAIEWCDHTFNPWIGCTYVSRGCDNCYAKRDMARWGNRYLWGKGAPRQRTSAHYWNQPFKWSCQAADAPRRPRVFCGSLCDVFDEEAPSVWRDDLFDLISKTAHLDWLLLTKRPAAMRAALTCVGVPVELPNVWLGVSCSTQAAANERVPILLDIPARVRFLSCEPLIETINLRKGVYLAHPDDGYLGTTLEGIDWVIAGGESGPLARPISGDWVRFMRDQCASAGVPFLFKQWGAFDATGRRVGKKAAGRELDGVTHDAFPEVTP